MMASLLPTSAFSRVDFPAFGRPRMETNPETWRSGIDRVLGARQPHPVDAPFVRVHHFEPDAFALYRLSGPRHAPEPLSHQAADRGGLGVLLRFEGEQLAQMIQVVA